MKLKSFNKIMVIGGGGMLGSAVSSYFRKKGYKVSQITRKEFDIVKDPLKKISQKLKRADVVINCAGVIKPRIKKFSLEDLLKINSNFPWNLAKLCQKYNVKCFHIATDCVFSGQRGNYTENDFSDTNDLYGLSKAAGDTNVCMTLRTSIIGEEINSKRSLLEWAMSQKGKIIKGYSNHKWNGVTTIYLSEIIEEILLKDLYKPGVFHIHSDLVVTKYKLLQMINAVYGLQLKIKRVKAPQKVNLSLSSIYKLNSKVTKKSLKIQILELKNFYS